MQEGQALAKTVQTENIHLLAATDVPRINARVVMEQRQQGRIAPYITPQNVPVVTQVMDTIQQIIHVHRVEGIHTVLEGLPHVKLATRVTAQIVHVRGVIKYAPAIMEPVIVTIMTKIVRKLELINVKVVIRVMD